MALTNEDFKIIDNKIDDCTKFILANVNDRFKHSESSPQTVAAIERIEKSLARIENQFAAKWVETGAKGFVGAIMLYFLGGILGLFSIAKAMAMVDVYINILT